MAVLALLAAVLLSPSTALAKGCAESSNTPNKVPQQLWGELQSISVPQDATNFNGNQRADTRYPMVTSVDIESGYVFASAYFGFQIWDIRSNPEQPTKLGVADGWSGAFASWVPGNSEVDQIVFAIDASSDGNLAAVGGINPVGFSIWNTQNKSAPTLLYQDAPSKQIHQVYTANINGRDYAFAAVWTGDAGVFAYDMTAARTLNRCLEDRTTNNNACPGVYVGKVFNGSSQYVHGMQFGQRHFIVRSAGVNPPRSVNIIDVTNPANPVPVTSGFSGTFTAGVAMWSQGSNAYLAVRTSNKVNILDITSCLTNGCASLPSPIAIVPVAAVPESDPWKSIDFSRSGSTPMLFIGNHDLCHQNDLVNGALSHSEYVFDMSTPSAPRDITPGGTLVDLGETVDYWSWYYSDFTRGFGNTAPRGGKFNGPYLYRADLTLFDIHKWTGSSGPPVAAFTWSPTEVYAGDPITFSDISQGIVSTRNWSFQDGTPSASQTAPVNVTFGSAGTKSVSLSVSNGFGSDQKTLSVPVLSPLPAVAGVSTAPLNPVTCSQITWTANGATGRAPLNVSWEIRNAANIVVKQGTGNPLLWDTSVGVSVPPGTYTGTVTVSNTSGSATGGTSVTLTSPPALPTVGNFPAITTDPFTAGTVHFHVNVPGATQWNWDFGDGSTTGWISDPNVGPSPSHTYTSVGQRNVTVSVRNCFETAGVTSPALPINITQVAPLTISFQAQGCFGFCAFAVNQQITFAVEVEGNPNQVQFDWDGNGSFEDVRNGDLFDAGPTTVTHAYTAAGTYTPKAQVVRGVETVPVTHAAINISGSNPQPNNPVISVGGPSSGALGESLSFSATASNCTAATSGWSWTTSGGTISGNTNRNTVTIAWTTAGTKSVSATNIGCSGATGTKSVTIGNSNPQPGGLAAAFNFNPAAPNAGQPVTFDAGSSTGGPTIYQWTFGDGQTASNTTATVAHTYQQGGNYTVKLEVSKPDVTCQFGLCSASVTKTVTVGGTAPLVASFDSPSCIADFAGLRCSADVGQSVSFTSTTANATSHFWSFGDGGTANGAQVTHTWTAPGLFNVQLTVSDGRTSSSASRSFTINGQPVAGNKSVILPWIAQTRGALVQSSDLYLLNPGTSPIDVTLTFLRRGSPETNPPKVAKTIQPGATVYVADVLREMFNRENIAGFVTVTVDNGNVEPVITSFNTTLPASGSEFGQTVPGLSLSTSGSAAASPGATQVQTLVGLNDNSDRLAYFGISNPAQEQASFTIRFLDKEGKLIGTPHDFAVAPLGQRQFQPKDIREVFGVNDQDDYRVEIQSAGNTQLFPYGANLRLGSEDPSFVGAGSSKTAKVYLLGALSTPGLNHSLWQSDVVISNTANEVALTDVTFTSAGSAAQPTQPLHLSLQPGETRRLTDVIGQQWGIRNTVGVITLESNALGGVFPIVQGESYETTNPNPGKRFGQSLPALTDAQAAGAGSSQFLAGLRQDAKNRTTMWIFNPSGQMAQYDVIYLSLSGQELGRINDVFLPAGKLQQLSPGQHKIPAAGVTGGFTVQVRVKAGKILTAAQVVKNTSNDPAYIQGETR
jgi:PKD repeat protein